MKKGTTIGIGVAIVVIAIFIGIASIPDDVLIESPSFETSENQPTIEEPVDESVEEPVDESVEEPVDESVEEPVDESVEEPVDESAEESSNGNVIKVEIEDGVGSGDR